ncbi:MAG TPA: catalase HPII, partial [Ramlibacter sp.]|nr:catalase HPII [Ramlibacter sp.]
MPKSPKPPAGKAPARKAAAKSAARNTDSGPARVAAAGAHDAAAERMAQVEALAAAMPHNPTKSQEHGFASGLAPQPGATVEPESRLPGASTLSEENGSGKTGSVAPEGVNATIEPLDRVRVDSSGQMLTTNQGVRIADNQNSLKYGVRG